MHGPLARLKARFEYLRALRYELHMLPRCDQVQVCTRENGEYLAGFLPREPGGAPAGGTARGHRHRGLRFLARRTRTVHHAVSGQLPA